LILVRHPKPVCEPGLCYGRLDLECEPDALLHAVEALSPLAAGFSIVSSPARRAAALAERLSNSVFLEPRLQELEFGEWEGRRWSDLGREAIDHWRLGLPDCGPPGGESLSQMAARCSTWLQDIAAQNKDVLAVTHAGPIRVIQSLIANEPLLKFFDSKVPFAQPIGISLSR